MSNHFPLENLYNLKIFQKKVNFLQLSKDSYETKNAIEEVDKSEERKSRGD